MKFSAVASITFIVFQAFDLTLGFAPSRTLPRSTSHLSNSVEDEAKTLREKAAQLRKEVATFEGSKREGKQKLEVEQQAVLRGKEEMRMRYSAEVPILKEDGRVEMERCDFAPRLKSEDGRLSRILAVQADLPIGLILGQSKEMPGLTTVDDIAKGSNGELAGVKIGDLLRACTGCQMIMEMPTWQLIGGGIGRPKTTRMMFSTDGKEFEEVMGALVSNSMDPQGRPAWLVLERMENDE
jgi:hypothetical protein